MPGAWHNIHVAIIAPAIATKRKAYTVTTNLQDVEVAKKTSKQAAAMLAKTLVHCKYGYEHDQCAIAVLNDSEIVGHLSRTILRIS